MQPLLDHHLVFVGGKGGVGKTTAAAAIAVVAAERGRRCLLVSTDPAHSLGDLFDRTIGDRERVLQPNLTALEIDPDAEAEQHIATVTTEMKRLVHARLYDEIDRQMALARHAPGASEAALLERVATLMGAGGEHYNLVIFDTAPSGHTVRLLSLPEVMGAWTDGLLRHRQRSDRFSAVLEGLGGGRVKGDELSLIDAAADHETGGRDARINELLQTRRRTFLVARERLLDTATTAFLLVVNADRLSIMESRKVRQLLSQFELPVAALIINRLIPDDADGDFLRQRRDQETAYRRDIDETFGDLPQILVPLLPHDVQGLDTLRRLGSVILDGPRTA